MGAQGTLGDQTRRRLLKDFRRLVRDPPPGVNGTPENGNLQTWNAVIFGPEQTIWEGGTFKLSLSFPEDYPVRPPSVKFTTPVFHPNVYVGGDICLDILQNQWTPSFDVSGILTSIRSLLNDPNPTSPANSEAARLYVENRREYNRRVQRCVESSLASLNIPATDEGDSVKKNIPGINNNGVANVPASSQPSTMGAFSNTTATSSGAAATDPLLSTTGTAPGNGDSQQQAGPRQEGRQASR